jgi:uncharacterized protein (UPF0147 family)
VLLHYTRLHLSEADRVVRWLHDGGSDRQLLAARLLAWHLPASAEVVDAFLATARDWAMTTKGTGLEILRRVSRAAYHAGLAPWLAGLMADGIAPWPSRVEAASAMAARLRGTSETAEATAMLRQLVADQAVPVADRVAAAEGLAQCDGADRDAADQALRVLLAEPEVPAERRRSAAVVLAGLGPESHAHAVRALSRLLDDPDTPVEDLVQAATGLTEISADTHERSAEVFRGVLGGRAHTIAGRREAALGLAALGPHHLADSVTALTALVTDPGLDRGDRLSAVQALAEMGPDYVDVAADHVMYMLAEPGLDRFERRQCAERLGRLGAGYHSAAAGHLRAIAADRAAGTNVTMWALRALADIGPDYHAEAAQGLWQLSADSLAGGYDRICALGTLAKMDTHHRGRATDRLRAALSDRHADPSDRVTAAGELVDQGTQFHPEVVGALLDVIATQSDPVVVSDAAWRLAGLGTRFHQPAVAAMLRALTSPDAIGYARYNLALDLAQHAEPGTEYRKQAAEAFCDVLADASRSDRSRAVAAAGLVRLGRPYHRTAMDGLRELLRPGCDASFLGEPTVLDAVLSVRLGMRAEIAGAVRALLADPGTDADQTWAAAQALIRFGTVDAPEVVVALQAILTDEAADASAQRGAAVALARLEPARVAEAVAALRRLAASPPSPYVWEEAVFDLARLGEDAAPLAQAQLATPDADRALRETAASVLATLCPQLIGEALVELRVQAGDEHLHFRDRTDVITRLAELDESTLDAAISSHRAVLDDEGEPITIRSVAAYQLSQFDRAHWQHAVETLRRLLADPLTRPDDQQEAFENLLSLNALTPAESAQLSLAVLRHPSATPDVRRAIIGWLPHALRMEARRALLADHNAPITARIPDADTYGDRQLAAEAETAVREALAAVESTAPGRVEAAAALADLAHRLVLDAAHELEKLAREPSRAETRAQALTALARLGGAWRRTTIDTLRRAGTDVSRPRRERHRLVAVLTEIDSAPTPQVLGFLRDLAIDGRTSEVRRIDALHALRHADGLDPLRAIRDDPHAAPAARWRAAARLVEYSVEDRAASARVLDTVATDTTARAALRWRAAKDLARLGSAGRQRATRALESIAADGTLPVTARAEAARLLAEIRPDRRGHALNTLRDLLNTDNPHHRLTVLRAIGSIDTTEATPTLRTMARDRLLGPVVRLRCAEALTNLRRDQHEAAAIVARELMNDDGVPRHVRVRAARDLARWSELCREEARSQLRALLGTSPGTSTGQRDTTPPVP